MDDNEISALIKSTVESSIRDFFEGKTVEVQHVLDKIFPKERRIRSLIGGLETSFGERVWEPLAKAFAKNNGFVILDEEEFNKKLIPQNIPKPLLHCLYAWKDNAHHHALYAPHRKDSPQSLRPGLYRAQGYRQALRQ